MLSPYGVMIPYHLPPLIQVPIDYTGPFTDPAHAGASHIAPSADKGETTKKDPPSEQPSTPTFVAPVAQPPHAWYHPHIDLSHIHAKPHFPAFHHAASAKGPGAKFHWPHLKFPTMPWAPSVPHPSAAYATTATPWGPLADIRQTEKAYFIEMEVPGMEKGDESAVLVQWMSPRTIVVSGDAKPANLPASSADDRQRSDDSPKVKQDGSATSGNDEDGAALERTISHDENDKAPSKKDVTDTGTAALDKCSIYLLSERHAGYWRRSFTLPDDVDLDIDPTTDKGTQPKYQIDAGVILIEIPRKAPK